MLVRIWDARAIIPVMVHENELLLWKLAYDTTMALSSNFLKYVIHGHICAQLKNCGYFSRMRSYRKLDCGSWKIKVWQESYFWLGITFEVNLKHMANLLIYQHCNFFCFYTKNLIFPWAHMQLNDKKTLKKDIMLGYTYTCFPVCAVRLMFQIIT